MDNENVKRCLGRPKIYFTEEDRKEALKKK